MQIRSLPFGFITVTILLNHSVGSSIFSITSSFSMRFSSSLTLGLKVMGILRGGWTTGLESCWTSMWYTTFVTQPNPSNTSLYLLNGSDYQWHQCVVSNSFPYMLLVLGCSGHFGLLLQIRLHIAYLCASKV